MHKPVRMGMIGCGYWGPNVIRNFVEIPDSALIAIADLDTEQLDRLQTRYPQIAYQTTNYHDLFDMELEAAAIATPPHTHFTIAKECLQNGLHVVIEKPITLKSADAQELIQVAEQYNRILMVGHTFEYNPAVHVLKQMIDDEELGDIYYIDAVRVSLGLFQTRANVIWDLAPHDISIFRHILGCDPTSVSVQSASCVQNQLEDVAYLTFKFPNNILAHLRVSWLDPLKTRRITVVGSEKMVVYDDIESQEKIKVYDKGVHAIRRTDTFGEFQFAYHYGNIVSPYIRFEEPLRMQCQHFLDCIREGKAPVTDGDNGLRVVQILEAAQHSLEHSGSVVQVHELQSQLRNVNGSGIPYSLHTLEQNIS
ncbi:Gfo/Idh/MocA family oxidoreductase [Chloroflexi bacterium TSY]|nr:Gfo/Idh/MocA family oxidoreductase [Chloroflexi bacterium TSY]